MALLAFGASNFYSFREGFEVSLKLNEKCPPEITNDKDFATVICVKGNNASGKTNVLKALYFIVTFGHRSFNNDPEANIPIEPFFNSPDPCSFYIEFRHDKIEYRYELVVTKKRVVSEKIFRKKKRNNLVISREGDHFVELSPDFRELSEMKLRKNASLISLAHQFEFESIKPIYSFLRYIISNVGPFGMFEKRPKIEDISKLYFENPKIFEFAKNFIKRCDLGIEDIIIRKSTYEDTEVYYPVFNHKFDEEIGSITHHDESAGTKTLFIFLAHYYIVLQNPSILIMDEFDLSLHPHIQPFLLDLFLKSTTNPNGSQLIFTTHNTEIIDLTTKYRTFMVNKENNESFGYRLDEISGGLIRNDRSIVPLYNEGKIGGVPNFNS